ncbi:quinol monooxygenase YgiN [Aliiruegeria haliotis]|uniref:Quinol monooxygenase YgiN n=1 Tax=Aliiruegeria haliotis TaxID=1280846 RepID=A0A2T0RIK2_9RHOB|nr:putative quinol monooxygenase [Aliiruegeria haliotis]PRY20930.1 quinol monooxygenase YgiN [Aliiruegeria haliotis]
MFAVTVIFRTAPGAMEAFLPLMRANAATSLAEEPGCRVFDVCTDPSRPDEVFLYEIYDSEEAFQIHLKSAHFLEFDASVAAMVVKKTVATYREVAR